MECGLPTEVSISPNPVLTNLTINFNRFVNQPIKFPLFNTSGQLVRDWEFDNPEDRDILP
ncbi:MAG: hypothetical protein RQ866_06260 [Bacteroidales bacterium]|nr:hypothetical protein [Bacteroidales bacterium]